MRGWSGFGLLLALIGLSLLWSGVGGRFNSGGTASGKVETVLPAPMSRSAVDMVLTDEPPGMPIDSDTLSPDEALIQEKLILWIPDQYKRLLLKTLGEEGWADAEVALVRKLLVDKRTRFLPCTLDKNSTHQETDELYTHQLTPQSVDRCMEFRRENGDEITRAAAQYGVPLEIIIAIMKAETDFGINIGHDAVFNVFWSLAVADRTEVLKKVLKGEDDAGAEQKRRLLKRARWARSQLHELVMLMEEAGEERIAWANGSWAGAFGLPQFLPTSFRAYGRDGDEDGVIDLENVSDAAASIAQYLKSNGWKRNISRNRMKRVILRYNHSTPYAECVMALADSISLRITGRTIMGGSR